MDSVWGLLLLSGFFPLYRAWRANARTTLRPALVWAGCAWAAWVVAGWVEGALWAYLALCLSGCAGVAVLGARRPGVTAWNFVVAGLLAVLLRPLLEGLGELKLGTAHLLFLGGALAVPVLNYLPTRLAPAALGCAIAWGIEIAWLSGADVPEVVRMVGRGLLVAAPWLGLALLSWRAAPRNETEAVWLGFRDRFGGLWALRVREQFHRAAENAGPGGQLAWNGSAPEGSLETLRALLKRFGLEEPGEQ
jgi:hypothetical protein